MAGRSSFDTRHGVSSPVQASLLTCNLFLQQPIHLLEKCRLFFSVAQYSNKKKLGIVHDDIFIVLQQSSLRQLYPCTIVWNDDDG